MALGARQLLSRLGLLVLVLVLVGLPTFLSGCGSSSTAGHVDLPDVPPEPEPEPEPEPDPEARVVTADPPGGVFEPGTTHDVTLSVSGDDSDGATIFYSTDLSVLVDGDGVPTGNGTEYTDPLTVDADTVLKFYAVWLDATNSDEVGEGYVFALEGTQKAQIAASGHGQVANEAWRHWDDTGTTPADCAGCHTTTGYDLWSTAAAVTDQTPTNGLLDCVACHGDPVGAFPSIYADLEVYTGLIPVTYPSGDEVSLFESSNVCLGCHQGGASGEDVKTTIAGVPPFSFEETHQYAGAASFWGTTVRGGYHYLADDEYVGRNTFSAHPVQYSTCVGCHMDLSTGGDHTFQPDAAICTSCHGGESLDTLGGSPGANFTKVQDALTELYALLQEYATDTIGTSLVYDVDTYPHFFVDTNGDGVTDAAETTYDNRYTAFDATLLPAAYNYHVGRKEPSGYVHNGTYVRQLLHDTLVDLGGTPTDVPPGRPDFEANADDTLAAKTEQFLQGDHARVTGAAFRHWDVDYGEDEYDPLHADYDPNQDVLVPTDCAKCHTAPGYVDWVDDGTVDDEASVLSVIGCLACHGQSDLGTDPSTRWNAFQAQLEPVTFPSTSTATLDGPSNLCLSCHTGRKAGTDVDSVITVTPGGPHSFIDIHYAPAAASYFGSTVNGGYEYSGETYASERSWTGHSAVKYDSCAGCHMRGTKLDHTFVPQLSDCSVTGCHSGTSFQTLTIGVGTNHTDIQTLLGELYTEVQDHASGTVGTWIVYDPDTQPFFFVDTDTDGDLDAGEAVDTNAYEDFDDELLRAAYNYHFARVEESGYIHNGDYVLQCLHDAIVELGGTPSVTPPDR